MIRHVCNIATVGALAALLAAGCGGAKVGVGGPEGPQLDEEGKPIITKEAREDFVDVVAAYKEAEKAGWNEERCRSVAEEFEDVADDHAGMAEAMYNVGVAYENCDLDEEAKKAFEKTLDKHPDHQLSMTFIGVIELEKGNTETAEKWIKKAVGAGRNKLEAVPAYVLAGTLLRNRYKEQGGKENFQKAERALRTALAIEAKYQAALYQLAMLYYDRAVVEKKKSYLTLATLVCQQGIKLDPEYGPIYHALGKVLLEKNELVEALKAFERAFTKDPTLLEAYMSFAAINLNFRGYEAAKAAFEKAISLEPDNYDAHMGLGVALRGLGDYQAAKAEYKKAAEIDSKRTDYIFNLGLLEMDYLNDGTPAGYEKASKVFERFIENATAKHKEDPDGKGPKLSWVAKAEARIEKCEKAADQIRQAEKEMEELRKLQEQQEKAQKEMEEKMKKAEELADKEADGASAPQEDIDEEEIDEELAEEEKEEAESGAEDEGGSEPEEEAEAEGEDGE
jgi:tetratricopeptide (TPR) repeat protein